MVLDLTPEEEARILQVAGQDGRSLGEILTQTAVWLLKIEASQDEALERSLSQADRGEFVDEGEMERRFARMMQSQ